MIKVCNEANFRGPETGTRTELAGGKFAIAAAEEEGLCLETVKALEVVWLFF